MAELRGFGSGEVVEQQPAEGGVMGDAGLQQQGSPCHRQLSHRPAPVFLACHARDQASPFQALDGSGEPTWAEPDRAREPGHALGAPGLSQRTQQVKLTERQAVHRSQPGVEPATDHQVGLAQTTPDCFTCTGSRFGPVRLGRTSRIHRRNYSTGCLRTQLSEWAGAVIQRAKGWGLFPLRPVLEVDEA